LPLLAHQSVLDFSEQPLHGYSEFQSHIIIQDKFLVMLHLILRKKYVWQTLQLFVISLKILDITEVFTQNYASFGTKIYFLNLKYTS